MVLFQFATQKRMENVKKNTSWRFSNEIMKTKYKYIQIKWTVTIHLKRYKIDYTKGVSRILLRISRYKYVLPGFDDSYTNMAKYVYKFM